MIFAGDISYFPVNGGQGRVDWLEKAYPNTVAMATMYGMSSIGNLYMLPTYPVRYEQPYNADQKAIGRDMWKAMRNFENEQKVQTA